MGEHIRFPVMCRGTLLWWTLPPPDMAFVTFKDDNLSLPRSSIEPSFFDPHVVFRNGEVSTSPLAFLMALGFKRKKAEAMLPITLDAMRALFTNLVRDCTYPPSHYVAATMRARGIEGPGPERFGPIDVFGLRRTLTVEGGDDDEAFAADFQDEGPEVGSPFRDSYPVAFASPSMVSHGVPDVAVASGFRAHYPEDTKCFEDDLQAVVDRLTETFDKIGKAEARIARSRHALADVAGMIAPESCKPAQQAAVTCIEEQLEIHEASAREDIVHAHRLLAGHPPWVPGRASLKRYLQALERRIFPPGVVPAASIEMSAMEMEDID